MEYIVFIIVSLGASVLGSICGIGGGIVIKPVLDSVGLLNVSAVSFLSGATVLTMSAVNVIKSFFTKKNNISFRITIPLTFGATLGGFAGKSIYNLLKTSGSSENSLGLIQAVIFIALLVITVVIALKKDSIKTFRIENLIAVFFVGVFVGILSAFLGIGGGPFYLVALLFFFSMDTKEAAVNSLFMIFLSQSASIVTSFATATVPDVRFSYIAVMAAGGIIGGLAGSFINKKLSSSKVDKLFIVFMLLMIAVNVYNAVKFM